MKFLFLFIKKKKNDYQVTWYHFLERLTSPDKELPCHHSCTSLKYRVGFFCFFFFFAGGVYNFMFLFTLKRNVKQVSSSYFV